MAYIPEELSNFEERRKFIKYCILDCLDERNVFSDQLEHEMLTTILSCGVSLAKSNNQANADGSVDFRVNIKDYLQLKCEIYSLISDIREFVRNYEFNDKAIKQFDVTV